MQTAHLPSSDLTLAYSDTSPNPGTPYLGTLLLLHGFPQTSHQYRHLTPLLTRAGYRIIAPDSRGSGASTIPASADYAKTTMARDIRHLVRSHLCITEKIHLVGHDIGGMVAFAYAALFPDEVASLIYGEVPVPGSAFYEIAKRSDEAWHFRFHCVTGLAEALIVGREEAYLRWFFDAQMWARERVGETDLAVYIRAYRGEERIKAALGVYRAFEGDKKDILALLERRGKVLVPTLGFAGERFVVREYIGDMMAELHEGAEVALVPDSGHYVSEENPEGFAEMILGFVGRHGVVV